MRLVRFGVWGGIGGGGKSPLSRIKGNKWIGRKAASWGREAAVGGSVARRQGGVVGPQRAKGDG